MDRQAWQNCNNPEPMLRWLYQQGMLSERKARLFCCACMRRAGHLLSDETAWRLVRVVELYADGRATLGDVEEAAQAALAPFVLGQMFNSLAGEAYVPVSVKAALSVAFGRDAWRDVAARMVGMVFEAANDHSAARRAVPGFEVQAARAAWLAAEQAREAELAAQAAFLRDLIHPFRTEAIDPAVLEWRQGTVVRIAQAMYDERNFSVERMAVLADALEEAGCNDEDVLAHCRAVGMHLRGCWLIDLLLEKS
jgi:hypothetical protein